MSTEPLHSRVYEPELERQGKRLAHPGSRFLALAALFGVPGALLIVFGSTWVWTVGTVLVLLSLPPLTVSVGALLSAGVARWSARHWPVA